MKNHHAYCKHLNCISIYVQHWILLDTIKSVSGNVDETIINHPKNLKYIGGINHSQTGGSVLVLPALSIVAIGHGGVLMGT